MADVIIDPDTKDGKQLFNQGVKAFVLRDYKNAVDALGRATEIMVADLGDDLHDSLGDTYLYYGKSLLALYRQDSDPIGNLPKQLDNSTAEEQEPEEDEEAENQENEEMDESKENNGGVEKVESKENNGEDAANGDKTKEDADDEEEEEMDEDCLQVDEAEKSGAASADPNESFLQIEPTEPDADEEPTDLQVAWEVLELAKKIFQKRSGDDDKKSLAETLTTLGEISLESENYIAAINDFKEALDIQVEVYPKDSRKVAETYYNLGIAYASNTSYKEGIINFKKSVEYLEKRIWVLEQKKENAEEVQEMKDLIPEIYEKIRDLKSFTDETIKKLDELTKQPELASIILDGAGSSTSKQATDISHLVKRKRKPEENDEESNPSKK